MKIIKILAVLLLASTFGGCNFNITDIQNIDIDYYTNNKKNIKLAKDLMYYDPRYINFKVQSFNENTSKGMRFGYFIRSSDGKPSYRITYSLKNPSVVTNISEMKKEFEIFIPKLASFHASKEPIFVKLDPIGVSWIKSLFSESASTLLSQSSPLLKKAISPEQFLKIIKQLSSELGKPLEVLFIRAQYYEAFGEIPESVSLYYSARFTRKKTKIIRISMHQQNKKWVVMGFKFEP